MTSDGIPQFEQKLQQLLHDVFIGFPDRLGSAPSLFCRLRSTSPVTRTTPGCLCRLRHIVVSGTLGGSLETTLDVASSGEGKRWRACKVSAHGANVAPPEQRVECEQWEWETCRGEICQDV
jgi:hypothetical protein